MRTRLIESLSPDDDYDLVLVMVRKSQVDAVLPALAAARKVPAICFMLNTANGYDVERRCRCVAIAARIDGIRRDPARRCGSLQGDARVGAAGYFP